MGLPIGNLTRTVATFTERCAGKIAAAGVKDAQIVSHLAVSDRFIALAARAEKQGSASALKQLVKFAERHGREDLEAIAGFKHANVARTGDQYKSIEKLLNHKVYQTAEWQIFETAAWDKVASSGVGVGGRIAGSHVVPAPMNISGLSNTGYGGGSTPINVILASGKNVYNVSRTTPQQWFTIAEREAKDFARHL